jgi:hypothetical protein
MAVLSFITAQPSKSRKPQLYIIPLAIYAELCFQPSVTLRQRLILALLLDSTAKKAWTLEIELISEEPLGPGVYEHPQNAKAEHHGSA